MYTVTPKNLPEETPSRKKKKKKKRKRRERERRTREREREERKKKRRKGSTHRGQRMERTTRNRYDFNPQAKGRYPRRSGERKWLMDTHKYIITARSSLRRGQKKKKNPRLFDFALWKFFGILEIALAYSRREIRYLEARWNEMEREIRFQSSSPPSRRMEDYFFPGK